MKIVSNCNTYSRRELYISELQKVMNLTLSGKCYKQVLPKGEGMGAFFTPQFKDELGSLFS